MACKQSQQTFSNCANVESVTQFGAKREETPGKNLHAQDGAGGGYFP
jgi:hypothetical protein